MTALAPQRPPLDWREIVANATLDLAARHVNAARVDDPGTVLHPARLIQLVTEDARHALGDEPSSNFLATIDGRACITSPGILRAAIARHVPVEIDPDAILAAVLDTLESRLGSLWDRARSLGVPDHARLTLDR